MRRPPIAAQSILQRSSISSRRIATTPPTAANELTPIRFVAGEIQASNATMPFASNGARVGDLAIFARWYGNSVPVLSGGGWNIASDPPNGSYQLWWAWKLLTDTNNVTVGSDGNGHVYFVFRGPSKALKAAGERTCSDGNMPMDPQPDANTLGYALFIYSQTAAQGWALPGPPWSKRAAGLQSWMSMELFDTTPFKPPTGIQTFVGFPGAINTAQFMLQK